MKEVKQIILFCGPSNFIMWTLRLHDMTTLAVLVVVMIVTGCGVQVLGTVRSQHRSIELLTFMRIMSGRFKATVNRRDGSDPISLEFSFKPIEYHRPHKNAFLVEKSKNGQVMALKIALVREGWHGRFRVRTASLPFSADLRPGTYDVTSLSHARIHTLNFTGCRHIYSRTAPTQFLGHLRACPPGSLKGPMHLYSSVLTCNGFSDTIARHGRSVPGAFWHKLESYPLPRNIVEEAPSSPDPC